MSLIDRLLGRQPKPLDPRDIDFQIERDPYLDTLDDEDDTANFDIIEDLYTDHGGEA